MQTIQTSFDLGQGESVTIYSVIEDGKVVEIFDSEAQAIAFALERMPVIPEE